MQTHIHKSIHAICLIFNIRMRDLLSRGESLARVMAIVGHSDMETTNVYLRKDGIELKDGTEKLGYKIPKGNHGLANRLNKSSN